MSTVFSETLVKLRREAGFPTAYGFYNDNGGAPVFKFTYRKYLLFEQGKELPAIDKLRPLFFALGLLPRSFPSNELTLAWLKFVGNMRPVTACSFPILIFSRLKKFAEIFP